MMGRMANVCYFDLPCGELSSWVAGIATSAAFIFTVVRLVIEQGRRKRLEERAAAIEKESQASLVSAWFDHPSNSVVIRNSSSAVIYDVYGVMVPGRQESDGTINRPEYTGLLHVVPPDQTVSVELARGWAGMSFLPSIDVTFRDTRGQTWQRNNFGRLKTLDTDVFTHYQLMQPVSYSTPIYGFGTQRPE